MRPAWRWWDGSATLGQARRDFLTWPRLIALAEAAWTPERRKDFPSFQQRLPAQLAGLKRLGIGYYDPAANTPEVTDTQEDKPAGHLE